MDQCARRRAGEQIGDHHDAVLGHEHIMQDQRLAAGAGEAQGLPVVDDLDLGERHQQIGMGARVAHLAQGTRRESPIAHSRSRSKTGSGR